MSTSESPGPGNMSLHMSKAGFVMGKNDINSNTYLIGLNVMAYEKL